MIGDVDGGDPPLGLAGGELPPVDFLAVARNSRNGAEPGLHARRGGVDARVIHETTPLQPDGANGHRDTFVLTWRRGGFLDPQ